MSVSSNTTTHNGHTLPYLQELFRTDTVNLIFLDSIKSFQSQIPLQKVTSNKIKYKKY